MKSLAFMLLSAACLSAADADDVFETRVRPLLVNKCFACHAGSKMGNLQLDSREHILKGGNSGPAIVPEHPEQSLLIKVVTHAHERIKMPPTGKLKDEEIEALAAWIKGGAIYPEGKPAAPQRDFWSFRPVRKPAVPTGRGAIDHFIQSALASRGLKQVPRADKRTLIRRATFDLIGLPPTPQEVDAFLSDRSEHAFAKVVDRLLASPRYGERWGRYWLDVARYSDDRLNSTMEEPYPNSFRYRDWVIQAFNDDLPYDRFVKAQIAGELIDPALIPGLGFYALSPEFQDDRVDATTRGFLGLTVACAQCHDHKYDPIPTADYYGLLSVFNNSEVQEYPLAPENIVKVYKEQSQKIQEQEKAVREFTQAQSEQLAAILATKTARFLLACREVASPDGLDKDTLHRWQRYLNNARKDHPYLTAWYAAKTPEESRKAAEEFQAVALSIHAEKKLIDEKNRIKLGLNPTRGDLSQASLLSLARDKYVLWRDLFDERGVLYHGADEIECYLQGEWREHLQGLRAELARLRRELPPKYPFLHALREAAAMKKQRIYIRGMRDNPGEEVAPHFLSVLSRGAPRTFQHGSGRLELAEAIADPRNPLTGRVLVNRIWQHHFGQGIVRTPSNFGALGDRPSHPELLDYLAARFVESGWSIKAMHREIMLSTAYQLSSEFSARSFEADPENRLLWRANRRRLDAEALRDALLFVSGNLDLKMGGPAERLTEKNHRRAVYGFVSRKRPDGMLGLFDFPNPNSTSEQRLATNVPLQRLFFMNSDLVWQQAKILADRVADQDGDAARLRKAYRLLLGREASEQEVKLGLEFLRDSPEAWPHYTQVLLSSNEFSFVN